MSKGVIGSRVVAMRDANATTCNLYGRGVYDGMKTHPELGFPNPRITLDDDAGVVWGLACWWMPEAVFDGKYRGNRDIEIVPLPA